MQTQKSMASVPNRQDKIAGVLLGLDPAVPETLAAELAESRVRWFAGAAHHPAKLHGFTASLGSATLRLTAEEARIRMAQGTSLIKY